MLLAALLSLVPAADPAPPARVLVLETRADAEMLSQVKDFGDLFATVLEQRTSAEIIPSSSIKDRLQVAAAKVETGCDDTACMTEIAGAMDARYVVASRASAVGGRWLMRIELFDSQDLKVIAQSTAMSDSVGGLAAQAESLADELLTKAPMLPRKGATTTTTPSGPTNAATVQTQPEEGRLSPFWIIAGGAGSVLASGLAISAGFYGLGDLSEAESQFDLAKANYSTDDTPSEDQRRALIEAADELEGKQVVNNCVWAPLGWLSLPLCFGGIGVIGWGAVAAASGGEE